MRLRVLTEHAMETRPSSAKLERVERSKPRARHGGVIHGGVVIREYGLVARAGSELRRSQREQRAVHSNIVSRTEAIQCQSVTAWRSSPRRARDNDPTAASTRCFGD